MRENKRISVYLNDNVMQWIQEYATKYGVSLSTAILIKLNDSIKNE